MKDIDNQEIQVGDVVMVCTSKYTDMWRYRIGTVRKLEYPFIYIDYPSGQRGGFKVEDDEIFCLFYRKPTPSTLPVTQTQGLE